VVEAHSVDRRQAVGLVAGAHPAPYRTFVTSMSLYQVAEVLSWRRLASSSRLDLVTRALQGWC
jgi:hypothetical protein